MLDITLLLRAIEGPGGDVDEAQLRTLQGHIEGRPEEAASLSAKLLADGVTDIRVIAYFLFGVFLEQGPACLTIVLPLLRTAVGERWHALRPLARKEVQVEAALSWLFRSIVGRIDFHEVRRDDTFSAWNKTVGRPTLEASASLRDSLSSSFGDRPARWAGPLSELEARVRSHFNRPLAPPPEEPAAPPDPPAPPVASPQPVSTPEPTAVPHAPPPALAADASPAFALFLRKLEAFQRLTAQNDFLKAAVVAEDLRRAIESFDPRVHFPKLMSPYYRALHANADAIAPHWDTMESVRWRMLEQLYQVDLDAFLSAEQ
jgi:hypothetical protein